MTRKEVFKGFVEILEGVRTVNKEALKSATEETDIVVDLGASSAELVNLIVKAEDHFNVEFEDDDIDDLQTTIASSVNLIMKSLDGKN